MENSEGQPEDPKTSPESNDQHTGTDPHVRIFGAEVNPGNHAEWRAEKEQRKAERHARKEAWKAQRKEWRRDHHEGRIFGGFIVLLVGILSLLYTLGLVSSAFWHVILPFWPVLLILWGASIILGRHWFARFVLLLLTIAFVLIIILYGLVRMGSPLANSLPSNFVNAVHTTNPHSY